MQQDECMSIEDLVVEGQQCVACPYYALHQCLPYADVCHSSQNYLQLVFVPYNLILSKEMRKSLNIDIHVFDPRKCQSLQNGVFIFDEAHNIPKTLDSIYSPSITYQQV